MSPMLSNPNHELKYLEGIFKLNHLSLGEDDHCYYLYEYTVGKSYMYSDENQLIYNFKKDVEECRQRKSLQEYKDNAISEIALRLRNCLIETPERARIIRNSTLVPIPPSKTANDPAYDNRVSRMLHIFAEGENLDIRELLETNTSREAQSVSGIRQSVESIVNTLVVNEALINQRPVQSIFLFDDILTSGRTFRACKIALQGIIGTKIPIYGIFVARSVYPD